ncbi:hypothetical protein [Corynebacterium halotolerans]|uniref:hypothetical protein n=1 Tax=Corynebacterium halotolerans TaxID=225326 RepID=UPI003CF5EBF2
MNRRRILATGTAVAGLAVAAVLTASISVTEAQRSTSQYAATEFSVTVDAVLELEGSVDGTTWNDSEAVTELTFSPDQMALQVGEENAIYAPMHVRVAAGSNTGATANITETRLGDSAFGDSLRGEIYRDVPTCDAAGVTGAESLTSEITLRGQVSEGFALPAPEKSGEPGETVVLCVRAWMNDNNWLLGGTPPPTETATWTVTGVSD